MEQGIYEHQSQPAAGQACFQPLLGNSIPCSYLRLAHPPPDLP